MDGARANREAGHDHTFTEEAAPTIPLKSAHDAREAARNALAHGVEKPAERAAAGKPRAGRIQIRHSRDAAHHKLAFNFRDDGAGLDGGALRQRSLDAGLLNLESVSELEPADSLIARINEAAKYVGVDRLALSTQCGFSPVSIGGNLITEDTQERKLELVAEVAHQVW